MKNFEPVYKELENLFINKLPEYIEAIKRMIAEEATDYKHLIMNLKSNRLFIKIE